MVENNEYTLWAISTESSEEQMALKSFVSEMKQRGFESAEATPGQGLNLWESKHRGDLNIINLDEIKKKINTGEVIPDDILVIVNYRSIEAQLPSMFPSVVYIAEKNQA